ncbi:MAG: hypothetical protein Q8M26_04855 [Pseudolabrys sp.]|nr:hypothetical protein [Pseudolabrys sp.]
MTAVFPLWQRPTVALARDMIAAGVEAHLAVVDLKKLPASFAGRGFDASLLGDLPAAIDPCGENGEFHTFVSAGPMLTRRIPVRVGETVERDGFAFADLLPDFTKPCVSPAARRRCAWRPRRRFWRPARRSRRRS